SRLSKVRREEHTMRASYVDIHGGRQDIQGFALQRKDFAIDQNVHRNRNIEFDVLNGFARGKRVIEMRAAIQARQHAQQAEATNRSSADEFDEAVGRIGIGSDKHGAAGVLAVVEGEEKAAARVPFGFVIAAQDESAAFELYKSHEHAE